MWATRRPGNSITLQCFKQSFCLQTYWHTERLLCECDVRHNALLSITTCLKKYINKTPVDTYQTLLEMTYCFIHYETENFLGTKIPLSLFEEKEWVWSFVRRCWSWSKRHDARRSLSAFKSTVQKNGWLEPIASSQAVQCWPVNTISKTRPILFYTGTKSRRLMWYHWKNHIPQQLMKDKLLVTGEGFGNIMMQFNRSLAWQGNFTQRYAAANRLIIIHQWQKRCWVWCFYLPGIMTQTLCAEL